MEQFRREGLETDDPPSVAVNANSGNPHYGPDASQSAPIKQGDWVLLDVWGKLNKPGAVYYDITWVGCIGNPSDKQREVFKVVTSARDAGAQKVIDGAKARQQLQGWQVDRVTRDTIAKAGYGEYFGHGLGHSLGLEIHESPSFSAVCKTELRPGMLLTVEPGIYLPGKLGVRIEDVILVTPTGCEVLSQSPRELTWR
jgi:Xaa-Pro aminopeptidase